MFMIASEQYLLEVAESLPDCGLPRDKYMKHMEQSVNEYSTIHPAATLDDYRDYFGSQQEIAEGFNYYVGSRSPELVQKSRLQRSLIRRLAVVFFVLILVAITGLWFWGHGAFSGSKTLLVHEKGAVVSTAYRKTAVEVIESTLKSIFVWERAS